MKTMDNQSFRLTRKTILLFAVMIAVGLIALIAGYLSGVGGSRIAAGLLLNNFYFLGIALTGIFFVAVHAIAESGWQTSIQRIGEAMGCYIPYAAALMLLLFLAGGTNHLYEWTHTDHLDSILIKKTPYLNLPFFYLRLVLYFAGWSFLVYLIRKASLNLDRFADIKYFNRLRTFSAIFIVFYAITGSASSWDWLMSIDAHWFSTLYGWYVFSGLLAAGVAVMVIMLYMLRQMGYMTHVNAEHIHDLGKYLFAFSIFWAYLWFSQYMLIWYANIPEETIYFYQRQKHFNTLFYVNLALNFVLPFLLLMTRNSKRAFLVLLPVAVIVFIGHWVDLFLMIAPGSVGNTATIGLFEAGLTIGYAGLFLLIAFFGLTRASLVPINHPFLKESLDYHTNY